MEKFIPCRKCKKKDGSSIPEGYFLGPKGLINECHHHKVWRLERELERKALNRGFSKDAIEYTLETDYVGTKSKAEIERLLTYDDCFIGPNKEKVMSSFIYVYGDNGTQKTSFVQAIGVDLLRKGIDCRYVLMKTLVDILWNSQRDEEAKEKAEDYLNCDVLILDEAFSKDKIHVWASGNQLGYIDEFLRERINSGKGCIFISNKLPEDIESQGFSHSLQDLVQRELKKQDALLTFRDNYVDTVSEDQMPERLF